VILTITLNPCVDRTIYVDRLRVGEIIRARRADVIAGGKGNNVARIVKALGEPVRPVILVGGETGQLITRLLRERDGLSPETCLIRESSREVVTVLAERTGAQTAYVEPGPQVTPDEANAFLHVVTPKLDAADLVVLSGSVPCPTMNEAYAQLIASARERSIRTILDTRGQALRLGVKAGPTVLNCNRDEVGQLLGRGPATAADARDAAREIQARGLDLVTVTLGPDGFVACSDSECWHVRPPEVEVVNPVGAGDALVAGLAVGLVRNLPTEELLRFAQAVAAATLTHWHAGTLAPQEIPQLLPRVRLQRL